MQTTKTQKRKLGLHFLLLVVISILQVVYPMVVSQSLERVDFALASIIAVVGALMAMKFVFTLLDSWITNHLYWSILNAERKELLEKIVGCPYLEFQTLEQGKSVMAIENDLETVVDFFLVYLTTLIKDMLFMAGVILVGFLANWKIGLLLLVTMGVMFVRFQHINAQASPLFQQVKQANDEFMTSFFDANTLMEEMRDLRQEGVLKHRLDDAIVHLFQRQVPSNYVSYRLWMTSLTSFGIVRIALLIFGLVSSLPLTTIYLFLYYLDLLNDPIEEFRVNLEQFPSLQASKERIETLRKLTKRNWSGQTPVEEIHTIDIAGLDFAYGDNVVFSDFSMTFQQGKIYGLMGKSGVGKSTLINLICQLFDPDQGTIAYNGVENEDVMHASLLAQIAYIDQSEAMREDLDVVLKELGGQKEAFTRRFGFDFASLSQGQRAFLHVARSLRSSASVLILDETFAQVDPRLIAYSFEQLRQSKKLVIIISHDEHVLALCDECVPLRRVGV
ncbi:ABC transporter ATP-binding protein [uncultured Dubosiella sp.]|uniref:ATP-binding cassette domain-containing protein n=1 Tax=uncultured Dubosiella sp. TaxID=1937011 RepID=UPI00272F776A|nr:ABC transporter ATP-binding protein [uncultured Dubosiella sp.]